VGQLGLSPIATGNSGERVIKVYYANTPNVFKVTIAIEEMGLESERVPIDLMKGEQFDAAFLEISPNNRVPAIVDTAPADGGAAIRIFESGAILLYLAEKTGKFLPTNGRGKAAVMQWVMWQMAGQGPMLGQLGHFLHYAPEKLPYALQRFGNEGRRLYKLLDKRLADREFITDEYSIADMMCWPWIIFRDHHDLTLDDYPNLQRWYRAIDARPPVRKALSTAVIPSPAVITKELRDILFNQR
jgi:GSH-dependent disulfide-bond oxidoreductase